MIHLLMPYAIKNPSMSLAIESVKNKHTGMRKCETWSINDDILDLFLEL